ncbi:ISAs1 family transposase [uncultured Jannaschia sp.]|uniref:ISAs1 family transposase n=1 Tax=uncultured Jannaschia sp. TaxID=293347 RepID=UPI00261BAF39|nr:ISAs1 family transposase [uncultured Jannaschia sp.]
MLEDLLNHLGAVDDPRQAAKIEHRLMGVLTISVCAVPAGAESFEDIALYGEAKRPWLSRHLDLAGGVPSHDTVRRVLRLIDPAQFEDAFLAWTRAAFGSADPADAPRQVAIDGKTLRRSFDRRGQRMPLHLVSAFATREGLVLAQRRTAGGKADLGRTAGGGEQGVLPDLVVGMGLRGTRASLDAGFCHPRTADAITARGGDYLVALKGNCPSLHAPARDWFDAHAFAIGGGLRPCVDAFEERHGRLTRRRTFVARVDALIAGRPEAGDATAAWPGLRRIARNLVRTDTSPGSLKAKRKRAAWNDASMHRVVLGNLHA